MKLSEPNLIMVEDYNLDGMLLKDINLDWYGWMQMKQCNAKGKNCQTSGIRSEFMDILAKKFNFAWSSDMQVDGDWGMQPKNGTWENGTRDGVMGRVVTGEYQYITFV